MSKPRITPAGLGLFWGSLGSATIGAIRFDGMLILLGVLGLVVLAMARVLAPRNLREIRIQREMPDQIFAGEPFEISYSLCLETPRRFGAFAVAVKDEILPRRSTGVLWAARISAEPAEGIVGARLFRRGLEKRRQYQLTSKFPLGLFETVTGGRFENLNGRSVRGILVLPRPTLPNVLRRQLDLERLEIAPHHGVDPEPGGDFRGVRMWRPGDPLRTIHWPATARMGSLFQNPNAAGFATLMVRDWDPPGPKPRRFGILFHSYSRAGNLIRPDRFESALQIVAGLLVYCRNEEIPVRLTLLSGDMADNVDLSLPEQAGFKAALSTLAVATRQPCLKRRTLSAALGAFANCDRIFTISDTPIASWRQWVPHQRSVVCVDSEAVRIEPPRLKLRQKAKARANIDSET